MSGDFSINFVYSLSRIEIAKPSTKLTFNVGDKFSAPDLAVNAYSNEPDKEPTLIEYSSGNLKTTYDDIEFAEEDVGNDKPVTIYYTDALGVTKTTTYTINVVITAKQKFVKKADEWFDGFMNSKLQYKIDQLSNWKTVTTSLLGEETTVNHSIDSIKYDGESYTKSFSTIENAEFETYSYSFASYYNSGELLKNLLFEEETGVTTYTFTDDYIEYQTSLTTSYVCGVKINKFGYCTNYKTYDQVDGFSEESITYTGDPA